MKKAKEKEQVMNDFHKQQSEDGSLPKSALPKKTEAAALTGSIDEIKDRERTLHALTIHKMTSSKFCWETRAT